MKGAGRWAFVTLAAVVLLAVVAAQAAFSPPVGEHRPGVYAIACDAGGISPCGIELGSPRDAWSEPSVAVHPGNPQIIAVAVQGKIHPDDAEAALGPEEPTEDPTLQEIVGWEVNHTLGQGTTGRPEPAPRGEPCGAGILCLHASEDGGTTWSARRFPTLGSQGPYVDATIVFDEEGTLHVAGLSGDRYVAYASTADLGRTWDGTQGITQGDNDRPWLTVHGRTLVVTWQTTQTEPRQSRAAASLDGGTSWTTLSSFDATCNLQSAAVHVDGSRWLVACVNQPASQVEVHEIDVVSDTSERVSTIDGRSDLPVLGRAADGRTMMVQHARRGLMGEAILARVSEDEGRTWSRAVDLFGAVEVVEWDWLWLSWATVDTAGNVHALVVGGDGMRCYNQKCDDAATNHEVMWFAADPRSGDLLGEALLGHGVRERPADAAEPVWDDYHHAVPYGDGALLAWGHDGAVELSFVSRTI